MAAEYYIVFDLERNFRPYQSQLPEEIVDMGAVKIHIETMQVVDAFSALVKPTVSLSRHTTKLTGITRQDIKQGERFVHALERFRQFIGEQYIFVTWGKEDYSFLQEDCRRHGVACPDLGKERRFDLQQFVFRAYEELFVNQPSLKLAVEQFGLEWEGEQHRALADAENTAKILLRAAAERDLQKIYRRSTDVSFVEEGVLTEKGKKRLLRWAGKELKKQKGKLFTWEAFLRSKVWENALEQHHLEAEAISLLAQYFDTALQKAKQQQEALQALKKQEKQAGKPQ